MLILSRRVRESITIEPSAAYLDMTLREVLTSEPIRITIMECDRNSTRLGIAAPEAFYIKRAELK